ncbi:dual specificity protein phosphatase 3-like isoform X1 [Diachasmimorpha longicaudata]|uniref:dual specificity protein phosphatase 3-like isoform X1 n=1 Tax=Diachasmimorpha longicaudata TaxID=58733 RepID=UPI0030B91154
MKTTWRDRDRDFQKPLDGETTLSTLSRALIATPVQHAALPGFDMDRDDPQYYRLQQEVDCAVVYPGILIGDATTAKNKSYLKRIGVTHVLNTAEGTRFGFVPTNRDYYRDVGMQYLGLPLADLPSVDISKYFYTAAVFIDDAIKSGGKVFVHCVMGISRSATCVIAYLMIKRHLLAEEAIRLVRKSRSIHPNEGFLYQLARLDNQLRRHRL